MYQEELSNPDLGRSTKQDPGAAVQGPPETQQGSALAPGARKPLRSIQGARRQIMTHNIGERFHCTRCGYTRLLRPGEDGFRLYVLHEQRCNPDLGQQLWFPFVTEDDSS